MSKSRTSLQQPSLDLGLDFEPAKPGKAGKLELPFEDLVDIALESTARPAVIGNPLDLDSCPSLPKPSAYIQIIDDDNRLRLEERKLFNVLLAESWERMFDSRTPGPFSAPAVKLRRAIGQATQRGNARLRDSLDRLLTTRVRFPQLREDGSIAEASTTLISFRSLTPRDGLVQWDFYPALRPYLASPGRWARLHLHICARFRSRHALVLYEQLSLLVNRNYPIWNESVEMLREILGCSAASAANWWNLENDVLRPALAEINRISDIRVTMEPLLEGGRSAARVRFTVERAPEPNIGAIGGLR